MASTYNIPTREQLATSLRELREEFLHETSVAANLEENTTNDLEQLQETTYHLIGDVQRLEKKIDEGFTEFRQALARLDPNSPLHYLGH